MTIKHLSGYTDKELKKLNSVDIPIWERRESWRSPAVILILIGYLTYYIFLSIVWILKWTLFSWIWPFAEWQFLCDIGLHKYRVTKETSYNTTFTCKICKKEKIKSNSDAIF